MNVGFWRRTFFAADRKWPPRRLCVRGVGIGPARTFGEDQPYKRTRSIMFHDELSEPVLAWRDYCRRKPTTRL